MKNFKLLSFVFILFNSQIGIASEWKFLTAQDGIQVYTKEAKDGVMPFKSSGLISANIKRVLFVLKDHKHKPNWAPKLAKVKIHEKLAEQEFVFSEYYKTPWPAMDREFLLKGTISKVGPKSYRLMAHSVDSQETYRKLASENHVQAQVEYINILLTELSPNQTKIDFEFHGDMKGWMPLWLMNLIQKKWPLRFIQGLRKYILKDNPKISAEKTR